MSKMAKDLVAEINATELCSPNWVDDEVDVDGIEEVARIDPDEHRWYIIETVVFKAEDGFFGVRGPTSLKSESMVYDDIGCGCEAFEMDEVPSVTYKRRD